MRGVKVAGPRATIGRLRIEPTETEMDEHKGLDISGPALVGMALAQSILGALRRKGILSEPEADEILEKALSALETQLPPGDPAVRNARRLAELIARVVSEERQKPAR
jgi:hypothetical protein